MFKTQDTLNYGPVIAGSTKLNTLKFKNTGNLDIQISSLDNIQKPFELIKTIPDLPCTLKPNEELSYIIQYSPQLPISDTIKVAQIIVEPCNLSASTVLIGHSYDGTAECIVYIQSGKTKTGDKINLPLMLKSSKNLINENNPVKFTAVISFNPTILIPDFAFTNSQDLPKMRTISIEGEAVNDTGLLKDLPFTACLGNSVCTDIIIDTLIWQSNSHITTETENGTFCISNICPEGGIRLIDPNNKAALLSLTPNPAENTIELEFSLTEKSYTEISLYNILGNKVKTIFSENVNIFNTRKIKADISDLSSGRYLLVFKTATVVETANLQVVK